jgi:nuclear pore complex protein Nup205
MILSNATSPRASSQVEQELFEELVALKPLLVKILDFGPRRPEEQKDIESGEFGIIP